VGLNILELPVFLEARISRNKRGENLGSTMRQSDFPHHQFRTKNLCSFRWFGAYFFALSSNNTY